MTEHFDKGEDYTAFWDAVYGEDNFNEEQIVELRKHLPLDNPRPPTDTIEFTDIDLPF
jgi:hypothetical protein